MSSEKNSWKCGVCGYVSDTDTPPETCPVCGVPKEKFDQYESPAAVPDTPTFWKCMVCSFQQKGDAPPAHCPVCGADNEKFEGVKASKSDSAVTKKQTVVIGGAGIAGLAAAEEVRSLSNMVDITLIHREKELPYYRLNLTRYIAGEVTRDSLPIHPESWYADNNINLVKDTAISEIHSDIQSVTLQDGTFVRYDKLILTAGSRAFQPPVPGADLNGVTTLRYIHDAEAIISQSEKATSVVVIGGGVLGLEVAGALAARNSSLKVTIVEGYDYLMPRQLNRKAAEHLKRHLTGIGIDVRTSSSVDSINGTGSVEEVVLGNGETIKAGLVVFSVGVRPETHLARSCGLKVNNGIIVDDTMETSVSGVYAAGDVAEHRGVLYGLWNAAMYQGKIAGMNAVGQKTDFGGIPRSNTLKVLDVNLFSIGTFAACDGSCRSIEKEETDRYAYILFRDGRIEGAVFYGDTNYGALVKTAIEAKISFPGSLIRQQDLAALFGYLKEQV